MVGRVSEFYELIFPKEKDFILKQAIFLRNFLETTPLTFDTIKLTDKQSSIF